MTQATTRIKLRHIVPSIVTVFAICAGMTAIRMSLDGHLETGLFFILLAVFLDAADGKLARFLIVPLRARLSHRSPIQLSG